MWQNIGVQRLQEKKTVYIYYALMNIKITSRSIKLTHTVFKKYEITP